MGKALAIRDEMSIERKQVEDLAERLADFLPGSKTLPKETRLAMAQIAVMHRLDPFLGDIWPIADRQNVNGQWQTTGYKIMIGITAWRRSAHDSGEYWGRRFEKCSDDERQWLGVGVNDLAIKCVVMRRHTGSQPMEFDGYGVFKQGEKSKMNPLQCVRLRAERDALKGAFPISLGGGNVKIAVADDNGEEINGEHGEWELVGSDVTAHDEDKYAPEPSKQIDQIINRAIADNTHDGKVDHDAVIAQANGDLVDEGLKSPSKKCTIKTAKWSGALADLQKKTAYYNGKDGSINGYHATNAAAKCGYSEVTDENLQHVMQDLYQHALEKTIEAA